MTKTTRPKKEPETIQKQYVLKKEFIGSVHCDGKNSIQLSHINSDEVEKYFTADLIKIYYEQN